MRKNTSQQDTKKNNKLSILNAIRHSPHISQALIAQELRLRPSTVSNLSRELMEQGFISITGKGESGKNGGKPSNLLTISPDFAHFSGMYIHQDHIVSHLMDYAGVIQHTETKPFNPESPDTVPDLVSEEIHHHLDMCDNYSGAGITISSIVNEQGDVSTSPDFPWEIPDFTNKIISRTLDIFPVTVENDANCAALYMHHLFKERYPNLLLFLYNATHRSLGAGLIIGGRLYKGTRGEAGEILHQEKSDVVESFSSYIVRIGSFLSPDQLIIAGDGSTGDRTIERMYRRVSEEVTAFPITLRMEAKLPVMGAAQLISRAVTEQCVSE